MPPTTPDAGHREAAQSAGFPPTTLRRAPVHSGNRVEPGDLCSKGRSLSDPAAEPFDSSFQVIDLRQTPRSESSDGVEADPRVPPPVGRASLESARPNWQARRQRLSRRPPVPPASPCRDAVDVADHAGHLMLATSSTFLQPDRCGRGRAPEKSDSESTHAVHAHSGRHKTTAQQTMGEQFRVHSASRTSVLRPGTAFRCCALTTSKLELPFQNVIDRLPRTPVDSIATCVQPSRTANRQPQELLGHGPKPANPFCQSPPNHLSKQVGIICCGPQSTTSLEITSFA